MKYFKDAGNKVYAYESDGSQDGVIQPGLMPISEQEAMTIAVPVIDAKAAAMAALVAIDLASIRALREYVASKADAPQILKDREAAAVVERAKLK